MGKWSQIGLLNLFDVLMFKVRRKFVFWINIMMRKFVNMVKLF